MFVLRHGETHQSANISTKLYAKYSADRSAYACSTEISPSVSQEFDDDRQEQHCNHGGTDGAHPIAQKTITYL